MFSGGSTVVELLTHDPKFEGSNPAPSVTRRKKRKKQNFIKII